MGKWAIDRHLAIIDGLAAAYVRGAGPADVPALVAALTATLPRAYGVVSGGVLVAPAGQRSAPLDVVVWDRTVPATVAALPAGTIDVAQAVVALMLAPSYAEDALAAALAAIASVKALLAPAGRLPLGIVLGGALADAAATPAAHALSLQAALTRQPPALRPDRVTLVAEALEYRHPADDRQTRSATSFGITRLPDLTRARACYICKELYTRRHFWYDLLCPRCGDSNYQKRVSTADLAERRAVVTGARVNIGYATALRLLRAGASVIATTRFPHDAARRYAQEPDFAIWRDRLRIYALDLRHLPSVAAFTRHLHATLPDLDILINNAAQTIRRPPAFFAHLLAGEQEPLASDLQPLLPLMTAWQTAALPDAPHLALAVPDSPPDDDATAAHFPPGQRDPWGQQLDLRPVNSWALHLEEVAPLEMLEVQIVNVTAPYMLISELLPLLRQSARPRRHIVNVAAAEGQFAQLKLGVHPHTNMAKAALNMLTRTVAPELATQGILLNSVDPGWISPQVPTPDHATLVAQLALLPLDMTDAAARICDPIFAGSMLSGQLLKDYGAVAW